MLWEKDLEELKGNWGRYLDKDGDGIPYRTIPGNKHPLSSYFTRGTGHDEHARYTEDSSVFLKNMERLKKKFETAKEYLPISVTAHTEAQRSASSAMVPPKPPSTKPCIQLETEHGMQDSFLRVRAVPFTAEVDEFISKHDQIYVVEMNRDGQLHQFLTLAYPRSRHNSSPLRLAMACPPPPDGCVKGSWQNANAAEAAVEEIPCTVMEARE